VTTSNLNHSGVMGAAETGWGRRRQVGLREKMGAEQITGLVLQMEEAKAWGRGEAEGDEGVVEEGRGARGRCGWRSQRRWRPQGHHAMDLNHLLHRFRRITERAHYSHDHGSRPQLP
jgi:hypothetical protein